MHWLWACFLAKPQINSVWVKSSTAVVSATPLACLGLSRLVFAHRLSDAIAKYRTLGIAVQGLSPAAKVCISFLSMSFCNVL